LFQNAHSTPVPTVQPVWVALPVPEKSAGPPAISQHGERALSMAILDVMTRSAITVTPGDTLKRAMTLMTSHRVRHLIVIGKLGMANSSAAIVLSRGQNHI
jgi:CBS domain